MLTLAVNTASSKLRVQFVVTQISPFALPLLCMLKSSYSLEYREIRLRITYRLRGIVREEFCSYTHQE